MSTLSFSDTEIHVAQVGPKLIIELKLTLDFWFSSFHLPQNEGTGTIITPVHLIYVELEIKPKALRMMGKPPAN